MKFLAAGFILRHVRAAAGWRMRAWRRTDDDVYLLEWTQCGSRVKYYP